MNFLRFYLNSQLSRYVISNLSSHRCLLTLSNHFSQQSFLSNQQSEYLSLRRMRISESSCMIMLIVYHFQQSRIITIVHSLCCQRKGTLYALTSDMTSFFISRISQSIISVAYNSGFSLHIELGFFGTKKHHSIIFESSMLVNSLNEVL